MENREELCDVPHEIEKEFERRLETVISRAIGRASVRPFDNRVRSNIVRALGGEFMEYAQSLLRSLVTVLGLYAHEIVAPFFYGCQPAKRPFSMTCDRLWYENETRPRTVKVILSTDGLNSTQLMRIEQEARRYTTPLILSLDGVFENGARIRHVGRVAWLSGPETWKLLTGCNKGYKWWLRKLYKIARPYKETLLDKFMETYHTKKRPKFFSSQMTLQNGTKSVSK